MKLPNDISPSGLALVLLAASATNLVAQDFNLRVENPVDQQRVDWSEDSIWLEGSPPTEDSDVFMEGQLDSFDTPVYIYVEHYAGAPTTLNSLLLGSSVNLQVSGINFTVTDTFSGDGHIGIHNGNMSLGTNNNYNSLTKTLERGSYLVWESSPPNQAIMEWRNADIQTNQGSITMWGTNSVIRDENNTTRNALENFARNEGTIAIEDGYIMNIVGNLTNTTNGVFSINYNPWPRNPQLNIAGNLINDGEVNLYGKTVMNVAGGYSGNGSITSFGAQNQISVSGAFVQQGGQINVNNGKPLPVGGDLTVRSTLIILKGDGTVLTVTGDILQTGGTVDTGPSGVDASILRARAGVYQNNATISGEGKLIMNVSVNNSFITPGNTPGKLNIEGNLTITGESDLEIELGGTVAGASYDVLAQSGGTTGSSLGGTLTLKLVNEFECDLVGTDSFTVVTSDMPITGAFTNVASGARLATADGLGTFLVSYGAGSGHPDSVVISDFIANPVAAQAFAAWVLLKEIPEGMRAPLDDADGNGVANLLEYAFGNSTGNGHSQVGIVGGNFVFTFAMPKSVTGLNITSQVSTSLHAGTWTPGPPPQAAGSTAAKNLFTVTIPYVPTNPQFISLRIVEQ